MKTNLFRFGLLLFVILMSGGCAESVNPTSEVTLDQIQADALKAPAIKEDVEKVVSLKVISEPFQEDQCLVLANLTYDNGEALINGDIVINYEWSSKQWKVVNTQFTVKKVSAKTEASEELVLNAAGSIESLNTQFELNLLASETVIQAKTLNLEEGKASYTLVKTSKAGNWTGVLTYMINATYDYSEGWQFTIDKWSYTETTRWAGTWVAQWGQYPKETQYAPNEKLSLDITGDMVISKNSANEQNEKRTVNVVFTRNRSGFNIPATFSTDYESQGRFSTRFITIKYGNQADDQINLELRFDTTILGTNVVMVAKSTNGNIASLTRVK